MAKIRRSLSGWLIAPLLALATVMVAPPANAVYCDVNVTPIECWRDHGTTNASTVTVGPGLACTTDALLPTDFNAHLSCHVPNGAVMIKSAGEIQNQSQYFQNAPTTRMRSVAIEGTANGQPGPAKIWVLRHDGELFVSSGDSRVVGSFTPFAWMGSPRDVNGSPVVFRQIAVVQPPYAGAFVIAVSNQNRLYMHIPTGSSGSNYWSLQSNNDYYAAYGGPYGLIALNGTRADPSTRTLSVLYRTTAATPTSFTQPLPAWSYNGGPLEFYNQGATEPFALGTQDAWRIHMSDSIYRAQLNTTTQMWSTWGQATSFAGNISPAVVFSIVDARAFRKRRGEVMMIGKTQRVLSFFDSNG